MGIHKLWSVRLPFLQFATQDAVNVRTFFGGNLNHPDANGAFQYFKRGQTHILSKDDAIAKK
jgi:hypothetical protein